MKKTWYEKRIQAFFILVAITVIFSYTASRIEIGSAKNYKHTIFSIHFDYYGMDSKQMEELITIPLEEKLLKLQGITEMRSAVEYSKSVTTIFFNKSVNKKNTYLQIQNEVDTLYETLPRNVQKPHITSSASNDKAILCIAFFSNNSKENLRSWVETNVKSNLETIDSISEVIVAGGNIEEIHINFDIDKIVGANQSPEVIRTIIQDANMINQGSVFEEKHYNIPISFDTRLHSINEINKLPVKIDGNYTSLMYMSDIEMGSKENRERVRINGEDCVTVSVMSSSNGNAISISKNVIKKMNELDIPNTSWKILYDNGRHQQKMMQGVFHSLVQSFICIILIIPFFFNSFIITILIVVFLILNTVWTCGILQIIGFTLNQDTVAGIAISLGLISDSIFVINEMLNGKNDIAKEIKIIAPSVISAALTTLIVLVPLYFLDSIVPGIKSSAVTIGIMIVNSLLLSLIFYPCFILRKDIFRKKIVPQKLYKKIQHLIFRMTYKTALLGTSHKKKVTKCYILLIIIPILFFIKSEKNITLSGEGEVIFAQIEFEPEKSGDAIDEEIHEFIRLLSNESGVTFVRSEIKKGSAEIDIGYDAKLFSRKEIAEYTSSLSSSLKEGFLYVPGVGNARKTKHHAIEMCVTGDEEKECREYAKKASELLYKTGLFNSVVLNFKNSEKSITFIPDKNLLGKNSLTVKQLSSMLRIMLFGQIADKWIDSGTETDILVKGKQLENATLSDIKNVHIPVPNSSVRLSTLGEFRMLEESGKIYRKNGRRAAYFTVESSEKGTTKIVSQIESALNSLELEKGYSVNFPNEIKMMKQNYRRLGAALLLSVVFIYIVLCSLTENFKNSLIMISLIPSSFFLPMLIRFIFGISIELGDIIGMIILSGVTVNNAVYILASKRKRSVFKVRDKSLSLLATSLTSAVGALPLLFSRAEGFSKQLAFFMLWGIVNSVVVSVGLFPSLTTSSDRTFLERH